MRKRILILAALVGLSALPTLAYLSAVPALAVQPDEILPNPQMEARARTIGKDLRCLVCQNESIDDSDADLAHDLRVLVRKRLVAGDSDAQVKEYIVDRYGDYVLLKPPFKLSTLVLWLGPAALFLIALASAWSFARRRRAEAGDAPETVPALSREEQQQVAALLKGDEGKDQ